MPYNINDTHDPDLRSWVETANDPQADFPIQNLPLCVGQIPASEIEEFQGEEWSEEAWVEDVFVAIGDQLLNISECVRLGLLGGEGAYEADFEVYIADGGRLNGLGDEDVTPGFLSELRRQVSRLLRADNPELRDDQEARSRVLRDQQAITLVNPFLVHDYTDFYASLHHATNVGSMFRPDNPLLPNYKWIPIGYHGRASSLVVSGTAVRRPVGQQAPAEDGGAPSFGPSKLLDYELEMGAFIGRGNEMGEPISIGAAEEHIIGLCLVNDWSARDLQKWEYQPLGPFLAKSFATTISPFVVTMEALAPFRAPSFKRPEGDPKPLPHLFSEQNEQQGAFDIVLEVHLASEKMREQGMEPIRLSRGNFRHMYWTLGQLVAHHSSNGCNMQSGDLLASGTVSGPTRDSRGSLLELSWDGDPWASPPKIVPGTQRTPIELPTGEKRVFLQDGDEVILKGFCEREGYRRIGFGVCSGVVLPARAH